MITNKLRLPQPFVSAATSSHEYTPKRYSVTDTLGGTCEAVLKRRHHGEQNDDVADMVWAIFGSAVHKILEEAQETDSQLKENWFSVPINDDGYELSGIFDLYDDETGTVTDYKTASVWKVQLGDFTDWRSQVVTYCWMLQQIGFKAKRGEIIALLKDHNKREARTKSDYPKHPVYKAEWEFEQSDIEAAGMRVKKWFEEAIAQEELDDVYLKPCDEKHRWHKDDKWAVMRKGQKRAVRVLSDKQEANDMACKLEETTGKKHWVEFRKGEDTKCQSYCSVAEWCPYGRQFIDYEDVL